MIANAAVRSGSNRVTGPASGLIRTTRTGRQARRRQYELDFGNIGIVQPLRLTLPGGQTYDVVITVAMDYRTSPRPDRFIAGVSVRDGAEFGPIVHTTPSARSVDASPVDASTTLTFQVSGLTGGTEYWISPTVNVSHRDNKAQITASRVVMVVERDAGELSRALFPEHLREERSPRRLVQRLVAVAALGGDHAGGAAVAAGTVAEPLERRAGASVPRRGSRAR